MSVVVASKLSSSSLRSSIPNKECNIICSGTGLSCPPFGTQCDTTTKDVPENLVTKIFF